MEELNPSMKNTFGIDNSWIDAGLDIELINNVMQIISEKRKDREIYRRDENTNNRC